MNRKQRRASAKQDRASRQKHQFVRVDFRPDGGFVVLEACGLFFPGSREALALHEVEHSLYARADLPMIEELGPEVLGSLALANAKAKKGGYIITMNTGQIAKQGDIVDLDDEAPCLGTIRRAQTA